MARFKVVPLAIVGSTFPFKRAGVRKPVIVVGLTVMWNAPINGQVVLEGGDVVCLPCCTDRALGGGLIANGTGSALCCSGLTVAVPLVVTSWPSKLKVNDGVALGFSVPLVAVPGVNGMTIAPADKGIAEAWEDGADSPAMFTAVTT
jgi:hypothetical protein